MVTVANPRWENPGQTLVRVEVDGVETILPPMPSHPHYKAILDAELEIAAYATPVVTQDELFAYLADKRFRVETGGILIPGDPPLPCWTDRATQSMLGRVLDSLDRGFVAAPLNIKTPAGALSMSQVQIEAIAALVAQHVQACFDLEATLAAGIAAETITSTSQIDAAAWPSNG